MRSPDLYLGDCLFWLAMLPDNSVDSIVTDPPYGLTANKKGGSGAASVNLESPYGRARIGTGNGAGGFMGLKWDSDVPGVEVWAECLRVLKPGGHLLAFAGTRTQHRMAVRIEDAGFEIRDMIAWVYGSGFPKSLDVLKAIDKAAGAEREVVGVAGKSGSVRNSMAGDFAGGEYMATAPATPEAQQWAGWGTALKPALEPITVARKPLVGTVAENVLAHGTGALNVDGCRVYADDAQGGTYTVKRFAPGASVNKDGNWKQDVEFTGEMKAGRWPANLIHDGSEEVVAGFPDSNGSGSARTLRRGQRDDGWGMADQSGELRDAGTGSAARFFYCAKASKRDRDEGCEGLEPRSNMRVNGPRESEEAKHATKRSNHHPTVKPTDLMRYLCRLVTPPGGTVLDPFMGSGSTGKAAALEGFHFIGMERDADYFTIAQARIDHARKAD